MITLVSNHDRSYRSDGVYALRLTDGKINVPLTITKTVKGNWAIHSVHADAIRLLLDMKTLKMLFAEYCVNFNVAAIGKLCWYHDNV